MRGQVVTPTGELLPADPTPPSFNDRAFRAAKLLGAGVGGLGVGIASGYGAGELARYLVPAATGRPLDPRLVQALAPAVGALAGLGGAAWMANATGAMQDVAQR